MIYELWYTCATIRFMKGQHSRWVFGPVGHASEASTLAKFTHVVPGLGDDDVMAGVSN